MNSFRPKILLFIIFSLNFLSPPIKAETVVKLEKSVIIFAAEMTEIATDKKGGYPELASVLKQYRQKPIPTFFLFGGGSLGPSSLSSLDKGTHIIDLLNSLEPDAMGVAKREFSFYEDELSLRSYEAAFPLVASNLVDNATQENLDGLVKNAIIQQGSYRFGVISILDGSVAEEYALTRIQITNQQQAIRKQAQQLRMQGAELIILMYSHPMKEVDSLLDKGIINIGLRRDEHHHPKNRIINNQHPKDILLSDSGKVAILDLQWEKGKPMTLKVNWRSVALNSFPKDPALLRQVIGYTDRLAILLNQKIGSLATAMNTSLSVVRQKESPFANYITDALVNYTKADIALINGGTIRGEKKYSVGSLLTRRDIIKELPFRNRVALLQVSGQQIIDALENGFSLVESVKGRFPQVSGMQVSYDSSRQIGSRVVSIKIKGKVLDPKKLYKMATTSYLAIGGDGYSMFKNLLPLKYPNQMSRLLSDIVIDDIKQDGSISLATSHRLLDLSLQSSSPNNE